MKTVNNQKVLAKLDIKKTIKCLEDKYINYVKLEYEKNV